MSRAIRCWAVGAALLLCGCYDYLPPPGGPTDLSGKRVQITLTDGGSLVLAPDLGAQSEAIGGTLVDDTGDEFIVSVTSVRQRSGLETGWRGERVRVPHNLVSRVEERRFSKRKTLLASATLIASLVTARKAFGGPGGSNAPGGSPGGPSTGK